MDRYDNSAVYEIQRYYPDKETRSIDLTPMITESADKKFVRFDSIPHGSFLNVKTRSVKNEYYTDLLQLPLRNEIFVFDLND